MPKNLFIDASHPNQTRVVLKSENDIEDYEYEGKNNNLIKKVFNDAIKEFLTSRNIEGKKIKEVLLKKLKQIERLIV